MVIFSENKVSYVINSHTVVLDKNFSFVFVFLQIHIERWTFKIHVFLFSYLIFKMKFLS